MVFVPSPDRRYARVNHAIWIVILLLAATLPSPSDAREPLYTYETEFLKVIYYTQEHAFLVPHLVRCFENSLSFHRRLFDYTPSEKVVVLLHDFGDYGHGGTSTVPWNYITIGIEPFDYVYETMPANERINWLMHHELVHVVATDKGAGKDNLSRRLFTGKVTPIAENPISMLYSYLTSPRWYSPRWYHEGIAVFLETWMAGGMGRVLGGYDEMVFRTMVHEDRYFYDIVGLESEGTTIDFQVGQNAYLYGTRFVSYLALRYGPEKLIAWFDRSEGSRRYFSAQFRQVYGQTLDEEWSRWIEWEHRWQASNLERIRQYPVTEDRPLLARTLGSVSRPYHDAADNRILAAVNYPGRPAHIAAIGLDDGRMEKIAEILGPALYYVTSLAYDPAANRLFFTTDNMQGWRDLNQVDLTTGKTRRLIKDFRAGNLVVNPSDRSLWAVQHHNGYSSVIRLPEPYEAWQTLYRLPYGQDIFDIDLSPDGLLLSAGFIEINGRQRLVRMKTADLLMGLGAHDVLFEFENNSPANFVFSSDGRYLYGSSYYSGVSNLFRYDLQDETMDALTNALTGYFRPLPLPDGRLAAFRYTAEGFVPVVLPAEVIEDVSAIHYLGQQVVEEHPVVADWNVGSPAHVDLEDVVLSSGPFRPIRKIGLASLYPVIEGYKDEWAPGLRFNFSDPVGLHSLDLTATVTASGEVPDDERYHLKLNYRHWPWRIRAAHNGTDFYDLFGPTKTSRKGTALGVTYENYFINEPPRIFQYLVDVAGYTGLERLPLYQNVAVAIDEFQSVTGVLRYRRMRGTIGGVDREKGLSWTFGLHGTHARAEWFTRAYTNLDLGFMLPLDHSSIWLRTSAGHSFSDVPSTFANFYFGGFGNNWVDHGSIRRYREHYTFPGVELNEIGAGDYGKAMIEWTLPPIRFRRLGFPAFYANWAQFMLFTSGIVTEPDQKEIRRELWNLGVQVDLKLVLFSNLNSTLSLGYAQGFESGEPASREFMASLSILR